MRTQARFGVLQGVNPSFGNHNSISYGGVLFLLPALLSQGLMKIKETHNMKEGYYKLDSIILTLAFMILCRIKNPEQLKQCSPGEMGKLIGLDRIPEVRCLREKMNELFDQKNTLELNKKLATQWSKLSVDEDLIFYVDGHVKVYNGSKATLQKKYVSRQKLCLSARSDFWLHDQQGLPLMVWTGELSEKLQYMIEYEIIPELFSSGIITKNQDCENLTPICTLIFDREAYEPEFFARLWNLYRIAIITYRKNVKDLWQENEFSQVEVLNDDNAKITMRLAENKIVLKNLEFREIRKLSTREHQTALLTNHPTLAKEKVAFKLFNRWKQENFFKYLIADYSLDHLIEYGVEEIDLESEIVNPEYRVISNKLKKERDKLRRLKASLLNNVNLDTTTHLEEFKTRVEVKADLVAQIKNKEEDINQLIENRKNIAPRIKLSQMTPEKRITKLKSESAYFMSTLKMICYRAETAIANLLFGHYKKYDDQKRMLIKNIISTPIDLVTDKVNQTLTVKLHTLNTPNANELVKKIAEELNETETLFPGTNLKLIFKSVVC